MQVHLSYFKKSRTLKLKSNSFLPFLKFSLRTFFFSFLLAFFLYFSDLSLIKISEPSLTTSLPLNHSTSSLSHLPSQDKTSPFPYSHKYTFISSEIYLQNQLNTSKIKEVMVWDPNLNIKIRLYLM